MVTLFMIVFYAFIILVCAALEKLTRPNGKKGLWG